MTACVVCEERDPDHPLLACARCAGRLSGALRQIPVLVDELRGQGVEVDVFAADPVAVSLPAGPIGGAATGPRGTGTRERALPIRIDATDILLGVNHGARRLLARGALGLDDDQVGHLSAATILDGWARDWASYLGHHVPTPQVPLLCAWLSDRLPWALEHHPALDEFAADVGDLLRTLYGLCGHGSARPKVMEAPCPGCGLATLVQPFPDAYIECATVDCGRVLTPPEYEEYVRDMRHEIRAQDVLALLSDEDVKNAIATLHTLAEDEREPERYRESYAASVEAFEAFRRARKGSAGSS